MRKVLSILAVVALCGFGLWVGGRASGHTDHQLTISDFASPEGQLVSFQVTLSPPAESGARDETVSVDFQTQQTGTADGQDYQNKQGTLTFGPGVSAKRIDVPAAQDTESENNETFSVMLSNARSSCVTTTFPSGPCPSSVTIADGVGIGTITNDDFTGAASPTLLQFGNQTVGTTSAARDVTITNAGFGDLQVTEVTIIGTDATQYSRVNGCSGLLLTHNQTCTVRVSFSPTSPGLKAATMEWKDQSPDSTHAVALRGTGVANTGGGTPPDTTPPDTTIDSGPKAKSKKTTATFAFSSELGATFECSLDVADFLPCTSPATYSGLTKGKHVFQVSAVDLAGNRDASPATMNFKVKKKR